MKKLLYTRQQQSEVLVRDHQILLMKLLIFQHSNIFKSAYF